MNWKLLTVFAIAAGSIFFMPTAAPAKSEVKFICGQSFDQVSGQRYPTTIDQFLETATVEEESSSN
jgi:hypothetical protein